MMSKISDANFRNLYSVTTATTETTLLLHGHEYPCIGQFKSGWTDINLTYQSGFVVQEGVYSFVNPDKASAIAYLTLDTYLYCYYTPQDRFENTNNSFIKLIAHPRDPDTLSHEKDGHAASNTFALDLGKQIPNAPFVQDIQNLYRLLAVSLGSHKEFVTRHLGGEKSYSAYGVKVFYAKQDHATRTEAFSGLFEAPMLSTDPGIRQGFKDILMRVANPNLMQPSTKALHQNCG